MGGYEQQSAELAPEAQDSEQEGGGVTSVERGDWHGSEIGKQEKFLSSEC